MPLSRFDKLPLERRLRILETAAQEVGKHGYQGTSLNRILETVGISKGAAYYYFEDKSDLLATVVEYFLEASRPPEEEAPAERDEFWPRLEQRYRQQFLQLQSTPWMRGLARAVWRMPAEMREGPLAPVYGELERRLRADLEHGQQVGAVRGELPLELICDLYLAIDQATEQWLLANLDLLDEQGMAEHATTLVELLKRALAPAEVAGAGVGDRYAADVGTGDGAEAGDGEADADADAGVGNGSGEAAAGERTIAVA